MRSFARSPLWPWFKVVVALVAIDWALFGAGLFFRWVPELQRDPVTWGLVYRCVRQLAQSKASTSYVVGSSIVFLGLDERQVADELAARQVPNGMTSLTVFGATGADSALLAHAAARTRPWLVVLTGSVRDFPKRGKLDTPVSRIFRDATVDLPALRPTDVEGVLGGWVRAYWRLYRYRFFVRVALTDDLSSLTGLGFANASPPPAQGILPPAQELDASAPVPEEAFQWFFPGRINAESFRAWQHWRSTRRFADYAAFLRANKSGGLEDYERQTFDTHGPDGNLHLDALGWVEAELIAARVRVVVVDFPENPVLQDPDARNHYDTGLADAIAARLAADAQANGARFVDLRRSLEADDFYDLIHPNLKGGAKLAVRLADIVAEEWRAAGR